MDLYSYMNEFERNEKISDLVFESTLTRLNCEWDSILALESAQYIDREARVMMESGSIDSLEEYYMEANEEANEKKDGIMHRLFNFIQNIFKSIFGIRSENSGDISHAAKTGGNTGITMNNDPEKAKSYLDKTIDIVSAPFTHTDDNGDKKFAPLKTLAVTAGTVLTCVAIKRAYDSLNSSVDKADECSKNLLKKYNDATDPEEKNWYQKCMSELAKATNNARRSISECSHRVHDAVFGDDISRDLKATHKEIADNLKIKNLDAAIAEVDKKIDEVNKFNHTYANNINPLTKKNNERNLEAGHEKLSDLHKEKAKLERERDKLSLSNGADPVQLNISKMSELRKEINTYTRDMTRIGVSDVEKARLEGKIADCQADILRLKQSNERILNKKSRSHRG